MKKVSFFINNRLAKAQGFTLIELLVTISIFIFMTLLVVSKYGTFNQTTLLTDLAYDMALSIQTAQTYGISVKTTGATANSYSSAYGIEIDSTKPSQYIMFADTSNTGSNLNVYDAGDSLINTYNIKQGAQISSICLGNDMNPCTLQLSAPYIVNITFKRPDPEAVVYYSDSLHATTLSTYLLTHITITSGDGSSSRHVDIRQNGQISVSN